jgi:hypothetical protein
LKAVDGVGIVRMKPWLVGLVLMAAPQPLLAAPFCVQTEALPPQCMFFDAGSCNQRAMELHGTCAVNRQEVHVSAGLGHYCLLTSSLVSMCIYADRGNCDRDAQQQRGVCVDAPVRPESPGADPYRLIRPSMVGG